jgi:hypothetical protein
MYRIDQKVRLNDQQLGLALIDGLSIECHAFQHVYHSLRDGVTRIGELRDFAFQLGIGRIVTVERCARKARALHRGNIFTELPSKIAATQIRSLRGYQTTTGGMCKNFNLQDRRRPSRERPAASGARWRSNSLRADAMSHSPM